MREYILEHLERYPMMEIPDVVKLLYQSEFGGGHIIKDPESSLKRLERECREYAGERNPLKWERIGNYMGRLFLGGVTDHLSLETVNRLFVNTAQKVNSSPEALEKKLAQLMQMSEQESIPFGYEELKTWLDGYRAKGYPLIHHSDVYRKLYHPSYRVISEDYLLYLSLFEAVDRGLKKKSPLVIAVDGRCGSGKSWIARLLSGVYPSSVIHMDHFFLRPVQRTEDRLKEPGGNIDYERFMDEVIKPLKAGKSVFDYQRYDCVTGGFSGRIRVRKRDLVIVEGTYSCHPLFCSCYDMKVFADIGPKRQKERILKRNGAHMLRRFIDEWIPKEEIYFDTFRIKEICDLVLEENKQSLVQPGTTE